MDEPVEGGLEPVQVAGLITDPQNLREQALQRLPVPAEEPGDRGVLGHRSRDCCTSR
jgi:hypothetical protein